MAAVKAPAIDPAGPWLKHHLEMVPAIFNFEICVPVTAPVTPVGRVTAGQWPALKMARTVLHGGYEGLGDASCEFGRRLTANGHATGPDLYECYVVRPETGQDASNWRTELSKTLIG